MMSANHKLFYQFAALHSFLMGLLPFFIPVILFQQGYLLWQLSLFIAITGLGFLLALPLWQNLYSANRWPWIISLSFIFEALLLVVMLSYTERLFAALDMIILGVLNGAYLCFYWTTQRTLFTRLSQPAQTVSANEHTKTQSSGNDFGNFQIVVMVLLKLGILLSAFLLDSDNSQALLVLGLALSAFSIIFLLFSAPKLNISQPKLSSEQHYQSQKIALSTSAVFFLDGIFLYLESYFWLLSLYLIAQQDVMQLGMLVIGLTVLLAFVFWGIKSKIDALPANFVFQIAIAGYAISWVLRSVLSTEGSLTIESQYPLILLIAFLTSFFRLSFNKRFFDHAQTRLSGQHVINYLLHKSYLSQCGIFIFFLLCALMLIASENVLHIELSSSNALGIIYGTAAPLVVLYGFYASPFFSFNKVDHHA